MAQISIWISSLILVGIFIGCQNSAEKRLEEVRSSSPSYRIDVLTSLYGIPKEKHQYLITEESDEFRTLVLEAFPDSLRRLRSVEVWEYTWQTNSIDSLITVWYLPTGDSLKYICHYLHSIYNLY